MLFLAVALSSCTGPPQNKQNGKPKAVEAAESQFNMEHRHTLYDGRSVFIGINHSADTIIVPQSSLLLLVDGDTLLSREYYGYLKLLDPESYGITSPIPTTEDVVLAIGGEFAETGSFVYVVATDEAYLLYELKTSPKDGARNEADLIKLF